MGAWFDGVTGDGPFFLEATVVHVSGAVVVEAGLVLGLGLGRAAGVDTMMGLFQADGDVADTADLGLGLPAGALALVLTGGRDFFALVAQAPLRASVVGGLVLFPLTQFSEPTTGGATFRGGGLTATGRGRQSGLFVLSSGGTGHQCVLGYGSWNCAVGLQFLNQGAST